MTVFGSILLRKKTREMESFKGNGLLEEKNVYMVRKRRLRLSNRAGLGVSYQLSGQE